MWCRSDEAENSSALPTDFRFSGLKRIKRIGDTCSATIERALASAGR